MLPIPPTAEGAALTVEEFLAKYTLAPEYTEKKSAAGEVVRRSIYTQYVDGSEGEVHVAFAMDSDDFDEPSDPEVVALADKAIAAVRKAHPELNSLRITYEFLDD